MVLLPHSAFIGLEGFYTIESAEILHDYHNVPLKNASSMITATRNYKQLLDEVFVISRIIEVEVGVISRSRRPILYIERKKIEVFFFCFFANAKRHKAHELDMITFRNHAPRSYMT